MSKKIEQQNKNLHIYILIGIFLVAVLFLVKVLTKDQSVIDQSQVQNNLSITPKIKTYHSNFLGITINIPPGYETEEQFGTISLKKGKEGKEVIVSRIGTNNDSLEGYLFDIADKNHLEIVNKENLIINGISGIKTTIKHPISKDPDTKIYYFYKDYSAYYISTNNSELYSDLDQIAQSFRYAP